MVCTENARILTAEDIKDIIEVETMNPTVERLVYIETRGKDPIPGKIFPFFLEAWSTGKGEKIPEKEWLMFQGCVMQTIDGEFQLLRVVIHEQELGVSKRFWDKPPTSGLRNDHPFVDSEVTQ